MRRWGAIPVTSAFVAVVALAVHSCVIESREVRELVLTFDQSPMPVNEGTANTRVVKVSANGGDILSAKAEFGENAIRLPFYSPELNAARAMIVVTEVSGDSLNPLEGDFKFGADFSLDPTSSGSSRDNGDNLIQRGLYEDPSQFKLELDARRPTCRVKGSKGEVVVRSSVPVDPAAWYRVYCERRGDQITLGLLKLADEVDWIRQTKEGVTGALDFADSIPISIGGKVDASGRPSPSADQFNGLIDQVVVDIAR